jgi:uncharacterized protein (TIGR02284 family)
MSTGNDETIAKLNQLITTCSDAEKGFRTAANSVEEEHLRILFNNYCQQRVQLAAELQKEVRRLGGTPETAGSAAGGSAAGAIHRGWMNLKSAVAGHDDTAILTECEQGEDVAIEEYEHTLQADLPPNVRQVVSRQYAAVRAARDRIRELEKSHAS